MHASIIKFIFLLNINMLKIMSPTYIDKWMIRKQKYSRYYLNMNAYRNRHFHISDALKKEYKALITPQLEWKKIEGRCYIVYTLNYKKDCDADNYIAIVKKFFQDALVELEVLKDDNLNIIVSSIDGIPKKNTANPHMDISIYIEWIDEKFLDITSFLNSL